jgi:hypothetical protein
MARNIEKFSFEDYISYRMWSQYNYFKQNGIKEVGLQIDESGKVLVEYIELF